MQVLRFRTGEAVGSGLIRPGTNGEAPCLETLITLVENKAKRDCVPKVGCSRGTVEALRALAPTTCQTSVHDKLPTAVDASHTAEVTFGHGFYGEVFRRGWAWRRWGPFFPDCAAMSEEMKPPWCLLFCTSGMPLPSEWAVLSEGAG